MLVTINLYSDSDLHLDEVKRALANKDPIIFIIPDYIKGDVFQLVNFSEEYSRFVYVLDNFNISKVFAYLISFNDLNKRNVMIMAPKEDASEVKSFSVDVLNLVTKYTGVAVKKDGEKPAQSKKRINVKKR